MHTIEEPPRGVALPVPPFEMRQLIGQTDPAKFDNSAGKPVFEDVPDGCYDNVFDFGSGCGRLARQMMQQSPQPGHYHGIDLHQGMVRWCQENLSKANGNFTFSHHNVFNAGFNPDPALPRYAPFPMKDGTATLIIAWSVFTHTTQQQAEHYLREAARVLHDRGILISTWFLFEKRNFPMMQDFQNALYINELDPTNATIFDRTWLAGMVSNLDLQITCAKPPEIRGFQWELRIRKKGQGRPVEVGEDLAPYGRRPPPVLSADPSKIGQMPISNTPLGGGARYKEDRVDMTRRAKDLTVPEFVSYSVNGEDVLLRRLFPGPELGYYVDVGAAHPVWESDTKALRDRGWRGINVEPQLDFLAELLRERPDDVNLGVALSDAPGELTFFDIEGTGLSTLDKQNAAHALAKGYRVKTRTVPVQTLAQILAANDAPPAFELLKIDVEGQERAVLAGNDWLRFRPRVVVVEATMPETPIRRKDDCREFLSGMGWRHAWFDGLNDWYLAPDFDPPNGAFDAPPNIFDRFVTRRTVEAEAAIAQLSASLADVNADLAKHQRKSAEAEATAARLSASLADVTADLAKHNSALSQMQHDLVLTREELQDTRMENNHWRELVNQSQAHTVALEMELRAVRASTSWRLSAPIRVFGRIFKGP